MEEENEATNARCTQCNLISLLRMLSYWITAIKMHNSSSVRQAATPVSARILNCTLVGCKICVFMRMGRERRDWRNQLNNCFGLLLNLCDMQREYFSFISHFFSYIFILKFHPDIDSIVPFQVRRTVIIALKDPQQHLLPSLIPHSLWYRLLDTATAQQTPSTRRALSFSSIECSSAYSRREEKRSYFECENWTNCRHSSHA